jgi:hypothetical protein
MARIYNELARSVSTPFVWILEDDVFPEPGICELGTALSRPAVPAVCLRAWGGALIPLLDFLRKIQLN